MKNKMLKNSRKFTSYMLVLLMITLNLSFTTPAEAVGEILTIGSQTASLNDLITVPVIATFTDIRGVGFHINYDDSLLEYLGETGCTSSYINCASDVGYSISGQINVAWYDDTFANPLNLTEQNLLTLQFNVISSDTTQDNLTFTNNEIIDTGDTDITGSVTFTPGVISLNPDETDPVLSEVIFISTPTNDNTPDYTFNTNEAGTISYGGGCTSATTEATVGNNTITLNNLTAGTYGSCTVTVTDSSGNASTPLNITIFVIDNTAPVITLAGYANVEIIVGNAYTELGAVASDNVDADFAATASGTVNTSAIDIYIVTYNATDAAGNVATAVERTVNVVEAPDTAVPTVGIVFTDTSLIVGETSVVTFTFSEAITGFTNDDLTIASGTLTAVTSTDNIIWTATFTPTDGLEDAENVITIDNTGVADEASNAGEGTTDSNNYAIDTKEPTVEVTMDSHAFKVGETTTVTFTFSEAPTGFTTADVTVGTGVIGTIVTTDPLIQTAIYTPTDDREVGTNVVSVGIDWTDTAENAPEATSDSSNYTVDTKEPTSSITYSIDHAVKDADTLVITATFNEVMKDSPVPKIAISYSGGISSLVATDMTKTDTTHYFYSLDVPTGDGTGTITLSTGTDLAGNVITSAPTSGATFTVDNTAPDNQDTVFDTSTSKQGGADVAIVGSGDADNNVWFVPSGTTSFVAGNTMTTAGGTATTISAPADEGSYRLFVIDIAGNYSSPSTAVLTVDDTGSTIAEVTPVTTLTNDTTPDYTFSSTEAGTISYGGSCSSATTDAEVGSNTITFNALAEGTYSDCTITVTDANSNASNVLAVTSFTIDTTVPTLSEVTSATTPTNDDTPDYTFSSTGAGTISYGGSCTSDTTDAIADNNTITFSTLAEGTYSNCTITVTDSSGNSSTPLNITAFVINTTAPVITLSGSDSITIEVGSAYDDAGATAVDDVDGNISDSINKGGDMVGVDTLGTYNITYNITDSAGNIATEVTRTVIVEDTTSPVITILGSNPATHEAKTTYTDAGATANDNYDGNITGNISKVNNVNQNVIGSYTVTYNVTDANGNSATEVTRTVNVVDTTVPIITLSGSNPITQPVGTSYDDAGATASDDYDGSLTSSIATVNPVNINTIGTYTITYNISDSSGNPAVEVTRTVNIVDVSTPIITLLGDNPTSIEVGPDYSDDGATAADDVDGNITGDIITVNLVDSSVVGSYDVTYNVSDSSGNPAPEVTRTVNVVDTTKPVISLTGDDPVNVEVGYDYNDAGATVTDNYDGSVIVNDDSVNVDTSTVGTYTVTYTASDSSGNDATPVTRTVNITSDVTLPVITLIGGDMNIYTTYSEPGATATDNIDGDISGDITIIVNPCGESTVEDNDSGGGGGGSGGSCSWTCSLLSGICYYPVTYNVSDSAGNPAIEVTRIVTVLPIEEGQGILTADTTVSTSSPKILIGSNAPGVSNVVVPLTVTDAQLNVSAIMEGTNATLSGSLNIDSETSVGDVNVQMPADTQVSGGAGWTGEINLPQVQENSSVTATPDSGNTAEVNSVIEIGFGDISLTFNKAVRILIAGQAGRDVGYSRSGSFTAITSTCSDDTQAVGDALSAGGECKIDVGSDLVIWTKHFTSFATYTQTAIPTPVPSTPAPSGGGGGGGGTSYFVINASAGTNGSISPNGPRSVSYGGDSQIYTITPAVGYQIADVMVDGVSVGIVATYTFSDVTTAHTLSATFSVGTINENGDADGDGKVDVLDLSLMMFQWGQTGADLSTDLDQDGKVDILDLSVLMANWSI